MKITPFRELIPEKMKVKVNPCDIISLHKIISELSDNSYWNEKFSVKRLKKRLETYMEQSACLDFIKEVDNFDG